MFWATIEPVKHVMRKGTLRAEPSPGLKVPPQRDFASIASPSICSRGVYVT